MAHDIRLPAEWEPQSAVQMTFPHPLTDWAPYFDEALDCFIAIAREIVRHERLIIVCNNEATLRRQLDNALPLDMVSFCQVPTDDTWARDHAGISVVIDGNPAVYNFAFNGWGNKFHADNDNRITERMAAQYNIFAAPLIDMSDFILEGGSIDSDGRGTVLTTKRCLLDPNRNIPEPLLSTANYDHAAFITDKLKKCFGAKRIIMLQHGFLCGDDTDGHIDTLARFCNHDTIAYTQCNDPNDQHFNELQALEHELQALKTLDGNPYQLLPLPLPSPVWFNGERLPATYANFLIINNAVLVPFYNTHEQHSKDHIAAEILQQAFPSRKIIGIDCRILLRQHGSLHCLTMQFPIDVIAN
jgi:agmatine/peptidylarginine deiminase